MSDSARLDQPITARELLGVSHLVLSVRDTSITGPILESLGYGEHGVNENCPNPTQKAPFLAGPLHDACSMRLMVPANGSPAIEMLRAATDTAEQAHYEIVLSERPGADSESICAVFAENREVVAPGMSRPDASEGKLGTGALLLHVDDCETALSLWHALGCDDEAFDSRTRKLSIRGFRASNRLDVYFVSDREKRQRGHLDGIGVVCLSLFCRDADRLQAELSERGYEVGECFTLAPFGTALRIFFMRNATGEIYEFLSIADSRKLEEGS